MPYSNESLRRKRAESTIDAEKVRSLFVYDEVTGRLLWPAGHPKAGTAPGRVHPGGYRRISVGYGSYLAHRLVWLYAYGGEPPQVIDHINGCPDDNRLENLRSATTRQNAWNMRTRTTGRTKGVKRADSKFSASIKVHGRTIHLGNHETVDEAAHAYNKAAVQHFGEFACLNPVGIK